MRVLESDKAQQYDNHNQREPVEPSSRSKANTLADPIVIEKEKEKEDSKESQSYFRKRLFVPVQEST